MKSRPISYLQLEVLAPTARPLGSNGGASTKVACLEKEEASGRLFFGEGNRLVHNQTTNISRDCFILDIVWRQFGVYYYSGQALTRLSRS